MQPDTLMLAIFGLTAFNGFASALLFFILKDIQHRVARLEELKMHDHGSRRLWQKEG